MNNKFQIQNIIVQKLLYTRNPDSFFEDKLDTQLEVEVGLGLFKEKKGNCAFVEVKLMPVKDKPSIYKFHARFIAFFAPTTVIDDSIEFQSALLTQVWPTINRYIKHALVEMGLPVPRSDIEMPELNAG
ncbi:MAG: hypothetical protein WC866_03465 [Patescibacteria group bacterium]|jgi:hypothetical protein